MSYTNNPLSILAGTGIIVTPIIGSGANQVTITTSGAPLLAIRTAIVSPVVVTNTDDVIIVAVPGLLPIVVTLPVGITGRVFTIKDGIGLASVATPIVITPTASTIDGAATAVINVSYGSVTLVYSGIEWKII